MFGGSQFDGNAAFSGGGFMPSQATQTAEPSFSSAKSRDTQVLLPLTVKQINESFQSSDDKSNFLIDGVDVNNVKLVGMVFNKAERVTDVSFVIDDGTGRIDCNRWNGMYVRVHGHLKGFQGKKQLVMRDVDRIFQGASKCRRLTNQSLLCCVHPHTGRRQNFSRSLKNSFGGGYKYMIVKQQGNAPTSANVPRGYQTAPSNQFVRQPEKENLMGLNKLVFDYLEQPSCLEVAKILEEEGLVYSTIDENHLKSASNG
ncbi:hypothetical protein LguiB_020817 [Lonicera macranthoides]